MTRLYVGNVNFRTNEADLEELFGNYGTVQDVKVITDRETGRSRGFAFVEMSDESEANAAIENLDGEDFEGRPLKVNVAKPREDRGGGGGGGGGRGGPRRSSSRDDW